MRSPPDYVTPKTAGRPPWLLPLHATPGACSRPSSGCFAAQPLLPWPRRNRGTSSWVKFYAEDPASERGDRARAGIFWIWQITRRQLLQFLAFAAIHPAPGRLAQGVADHRRRPRRSKRKLRPTWTGGTRLVAVRRHHISGPTSSVSTTSDLAPPVRRLRCVRAPSARFHNFNSVGRRRPGRARLVPCEHEIERAVVEATLDESRMARLGRSSPKPPQFPQ